MTTANNKTGIKGAKLRLMSRLANDWRGISMPMMAIGIIPLLGFVGGSVDIGRSYLVKARLQQACDAGALAARRAMAGNTLSTANEQEGDKFFDFNFPEGTMATYDIESDYANGTTAGSVAGTASATLDNSVMRIFGKDSATINVTCSSILTVPNTDVMFVLDISGSMATTTSDGTTRIAGLRAAAKDFFRELGPGTNAGAGRIRYGFVPFNANANVGAVLRAANPFAVAGGTTGETWNYQTRVPVTRLDHVITGASAQSGHIYGTPTYSQTFTYPSSWTSYGTSGSTTIAGTGYTNRFTNVTAATCTTSNTNLPDGPAANTIESTSGGATGPTPGTVNEPTYPATTRTNNFTTTQGVTRRQYRYNWTVTNTTPNPDVGTCQLQNKLNNNGSTVVRTTPSTTTQTVTWEERTFLANWSYQQATIDVTPFFAGNPAPNPAFWTGTNFDSGISNAAGGATVSNTVTWSGCVEEARTVNTITGASSLDIPADAFDMRININPNSITPITEKWKPHLAQVVIDRTGGIQWQADPTWNSNGWAVCGPAARRLQQYTGDVDGTGLSSGFGAYVDGLNILGGTQHDIGMVWGARFLSPTGIFSAQNADSTGPGGFPINRHLVFMTDGYMDARNQNYGPWGISRLDGRNVPTTQQDTDNGVQDMNNVHYRRMEMICAAARSQGFTVWVIGFGISTMPQALQDCASDDDHWSVEANSTALRARFRAIAETIGGLRLSS